MSRGLRPGFLTLASGRLWAVDAFQPVAAVLEPESGTVEQLVSWRELPPPMASEVPGLGQRVLGSSAGLWVQPYDGGPVGLIGAEGLVLAGYCAGLRLSGTTSAGAWCGPRRKRRELVKRPPEPENVLCLGKDGTTRTVTVDRPIGELRTGPDGLYVRVRANPAEHDTDPPPLGKPDPGETWLHLRDDAPLPQRLSRSEHGDAAPAPRPDPILTGNPGPGTWHSPDRTDRIVVGQLHWSVGWAQEPKVQPQVLATGHDRSTGAEHHRVHLGYGEAVAVAEQSDSLWVALRRTRPAIPARHAGVDLLRIDARSGRVETTLLADSVDITDVCRSLPPEPPDADSYATHQQRSFDGLARYGEKLRRAFEDGDTMAFDGGSAEDALGNDLRSCRAELVGHWPDTTIHLRCTRARHPGLELVRVIALFDELGRQTPPEHAGTHLLEDIETGHVPSTDQAVDGTLYF